MKALLAVLLLLLSAPALAQKRPLHRTPPTPVATPKPIWSQEPTGFHGVEFGMTEKEASDAVTDKFSNCWTQGEKRFCSDSFGIGTTSIKTSFNFVKIAKEGDDPASLVNRFVGVSGRFDSNSYETVRAAFIAKYGRPMETFHAEVQNRLGAKFEREDLAWESPTIQIGLSRIGSSVTEGSFYISTQEFVKVLAAERAAKEKKLKDAL